MQSEPPKPDPPKRKRRLQFRLRTLMIVVTLFALIPCGYVGWQAKIVRERRAALAELAMRDGQFGVWTVPALADIHERTIPMLARWMGDRAIFWIIYKRGTTDDEIRRLRELFPEALVGDDLVTHEPLSATKS